LLEKISMPETQRDKQIFSLYEVTRSIQKTIAERYKSSFWVKAEMNKLNHYSHSGHCYPELVEKRDGKVIAQIKANLWKSDYQRINARFLKVTKEHIKDGISILFLASIHFDPAHGLCLRMLDIDPIFSLGELEKEKHESIERLQAENLFRKNKLLSLSLLPKRIAVISVETSKGYADYLKILQGNPWNYRVFNMLFPALLQGDRAVESILYQLGRIKSVHQHFDAVAIIRGGGGDVGLSSYNNYQLAREIAMFPIPVFTGIGHSTNETVAEMVSFKNAITPTELADFILQHFHNFSEPLTNAARLVNTFAEDLLNRKQQQFANSVQLFKIITSNALTRHSAGLKTTSHSFYSKLLLAINTFRHSLRTTHETLNTGAESFLQHQFDSIRQQKSMLGSNASVVHGNEVRKIERLHHSVTLLDPVNVLRRGFSITTDGNGRVVKSVTELKSGQTIRTRLADGTIITEVKKISNHDTHE